MNTTIERDIVQMNSDGGIVELETHFQSRLGRRLRAFRLSVEERGLVLRGHSPTYYVKQLAQHAIMEASEVPIFANEIEVA
jgi:hypothetical protein